MTYADIPVQKTSFPSLSPEEQELLSKITPYTRIIVLSPHLDDAILSTGSLLLYLDGLGKTIEIVNVFTKCGSRESSYNTNLMAKGSATTPEEYETKRKEEDKKAFSYFKNVTVSYADFIDAAWREDNGKLVYELSSLGTIQKSDRNIISEIKKYVKEKVNDNNTLIIAPLGCGNHVDHQIIRDIAQETFKNIVFYADVPYIRNDTDFSFAQKNNLTRFEFGGNLVAKKDIVLSYQSQLESLIKKYDLKLQNEVYFLKV